MMDTDGPLDFESEDLIPVSPVLTKKRVSQSEDPTGHQMVLELKLAVKKIIGLDDLLTDFYKEQGKAIERESKQKKVKKNHNWDDEDDTTQTIKEAKLSQFVDDCQQKMEAISGEDEISSWGIPVFGNQKTPPSLAFPELGSCMLLQSFMKNEINSLVEFSGEKGETFLDGLLVNGWLSKLVFTCGHVEKSVAKWTFNLMLYSSEEEVRTAASDFWCGILSSKNEVKIDWFPSYSELKSALETYGFLFDSLSNFSSNSELVHTDSDCGRPPQNIRAWIKLVGRCCQVRCKHSIFSTSEAEDLLGVIICLFLDRQLQGLSMLMYECLLSVISFFTEEEWDNSCEKVAKSLACRVPRDLNCLRMVECILGVDARSKLLKSTVAFEILIFCFDKEVSGAEEILRFLISINVKERNCDLFKMYIYLVLTENWLLTTPFLEDKPVIYEMWGVYLRNCSCQITSTDLRTYASKVRNRASYLLQDTVKK